MENSRVLNQNGEGKSIYKGMDDSEREEILRKSNVAIYKAQDENFKNIDNIDTFRTNIKSAVEKPLIKLAKKYSLFRSYNISNSKIDFSFSATNLKKALFSMNKTGETFENYAKMLGVFDKVVENAVLVEVHDDMYKGTIREDKQLDAVYVFLSAFELNDEIIPVELLVKSFFDKPNTLYVTATLGDIKKENNVLAIAPEKMTGSITWLFSTYSVPQIIKSINPKFGEFLKYIPDGLLTDEQIDAKIAALLKQQKKIEQLKKGVRGGTEYSRVLNQNAEGKSIYKGMDDSEREEILRNSNVAIFKAQDENFKNIDNIESFQTKSKIVVQKPLLALGEKYKVFKDYNISTPKIEFSFSHKNLKKD